jgi:hypothetical protein
MKISYIDLNHHDFYESYSINPNRYGGGRVFASWAKELLPDFHIYSTEQSFKDLTDDENKKNCHIISQEQINHLKNGAKLSEIIPDTNDSNAILHHFTQIYINTDRLQFVWSVGLNEYINPKHSYLMLYSRKRQNPIISNPNTLIFDITIGTNIPDVFINNDKENFIFQCTRHNSMFGSSIVANYCNKNNIKAYFAGPIDNGYDLLNYINNKDTFYLGQISEQDKIEFTKKARLCTFLHDWQTPFNLSAIDSLGNGTPILATNIGFWPDLIKKNINGFIIDRHNENQFLDAWEESNKINQIDCYNTVYPKYSIKNMLESFMNVINSNYYIGYPYEDLLLSSNI